MILALIAACVLQIYGTLWTPGNGYQVMVQNDQEAPQTITAIKARYLVRLDTGPVPDQSNFATKFVPVPLLTIPPHRRAMITFPLNVDPMNYYGAEVVCK